MLTQEEKILLNDIMNNAVIKGNFAIVFLSLSDKLNQLITESEQNVKAED